MCVDSSNALVRSRNQQFALDNLLYCQNDAVLDLDANCGSAGTEVVVSLVQAATKTANEDLDLPSCFYRLVCVLNLYGTVLSACSPILSILCPAYLEEATIWRIRARE